MSPPAIPEKYLLPASREDWQELLQDWRPLLEKAKSPWLLTKFGELFFEQHDGKIGVLQVSAFGYEVVAKNKTDFLEWLVDPEKVAEWFLTPLVDQLEVAGRTLGSDQCYSFKTPLGLGGKLALENVMVIPVREHFRCFGEVFQQIKDIPDGGHVELRVTD